MFETKFKMKNKKNPFIKAGRYQPGTFENFLGLGRDREIDPKFPTRWDGRGTKILGLGGSGTYFWYR